MPKVRPASSPHRSEAELERAVLVLGLLGHHTRLKVLSALAEAGRTSGELRDLTGEAQAVFSHHMSLMRAARLVETQKDGQYVRYGLSPLGRAAVKAAHAVRSGGQ